MKVIDGTIASPLGFSADGLHAGFKKRKMDFGWIVSEKPASVAGVYTTNKVIAAPLIVTKTSVKKAGKMKAIVVNSGVANSCTGTQGLEDAYTMQEWTAEKLGVEPELVGVASTGIIGELLPMDTLKNGLSKIVVNGNADDFAKAILTTDTATKTIAVTETFGRDVVTMAGVAKGSGMIHPNMATMLGFVTCDAPTIVLYSICGVNLIILLRCNALHTSSCDPIVTRNAPSGKMSKVRPFSAISLYILVSLKEKSPLSVNGL